MKAPLNLVEVPSGGAWSVFIEATGYTIREPHIANFISAGVRHALDNNLPWAGSGAKAYLLDLWCQQHPKARCGDKDAPARTFGIEDLKRFANSMGQWVVKVASGESAWVEQGEAERRALICADCPNNQDIVCGWCAGSPLPVIANHLGGRHTSSDDKLKSCSVCLCQLKAKVHMPLEVMDTAGLDVPSFCWLSKAS